MTYTDIIKNSVLEGFSYADIPTTKILVTLGIAYLLAMYIHLVYKIVTKNAFYYKNYGVSMTIMSVVTAGIILAMQSSLVISLGMVGALSIVRFRTAIKDPMDLLFLFWSIGSGIICGAGLYELAIITAVVSTVGILLFQFFPYRENSFLLVVNANRADYFGEIEALLKQGTHSFKIKSRNVNKNGMDLIVEVKIKKDVDLIGQLAEKEYVLSATLLENNVDVKS